MELIKVNDQNKNEFFKAYPEYIKALQKFDPSIQTPTMYEMKIRLELMCSEVFLLRHNNETIGFAICGFGFDNSFTGRDVHIEEFYILPEFQRDNLGTKAVGEIIKRYPESDFSAYVIKTNEVAKAFWDVTFAKYGYCERTQFGGITATNGNLQFRYWIKMR